MPARYLELRAIVRSGQVSFAYSMGGDQMDPSSINLVALNPQPLPPGATIDFVALNPQPLPPNATLEFVSVASWPAR
jgi:hypothetical protein